VVGAIGCAVCLGLGNVALSEFCEILGGHVGSLTAARGLGSGPFLVIFARDR
jgi:hypothetical protein